ncbi:hypothetical protein CAPTEDRAFT_192197 [Capitella teleta]|uniref:Uncharacterized protein n=1 Tax=Capitella teleta TaxID=283909 RepID=R7TMP7_CAPTE|nr:hypothetical protein CAPTEDRAFT_192197 [Capitella teleta]|eukprot:ELT94919.1 hypothetical protein CAPTEDRAFT_192197 [Capitella teleta]
MSLTPTKSDLTKYLAHGIIDAVNESVIIAFDDLMHLKVETVLRQYGSIVSEHNQAMIWQNGIVRQPMRYDHQHHLDGRDLSPIPTAGPPAPRAVLEMISVIRAAISSRLGAFVASMDRSALKCAVSICTLKGKVYGREDEGKEQQTQYKPDCVIHLPLSI